MSALEIQILVPELFEGEEGRLARRILEHAGVRSLTPSAIIWDGVIPLLAKTRCPKTVALCLAFLASRPFSDFEDGRKKTSVESALQTALKVPVRHGSGEVTLSGLPEPMLLGEEFHNILAQEAIDAEVSHAHEVLAGASSRSDHPCVEAPLLLTAAAEIGIQASQVARFLVQHCSVTMGHFPVLSRTLQVPVQEIAHHSPHLAETVAELVQEEGDASAIQLRDAESPSLTAMLSRQLDVQLLVASYVLELQRHMTATLTLKSSKKCPPSALATELMRRPWVPSSSALAKPGDTRFLWDTPELPGLTGKLKPRVLAVLQPHVPIVRCLLESGKYLSLCCSSSRISLSSSSFLFFIFSFSFAFLLCRHSVLRQINFPARAFLCQLQHRRAWLFVVGPCHMVRLRPPPAQGTRTSPGASASCCSSWAPSSLPPGMSCSCCGPGLSPGTPRASAKKRG